MLDSLSSIVSFLTLEYKLTFRFLKARQQYELFYFHFAVAMHYIL